MRAQHSAGIMATAFALSLFVPVAAEASPQSSILIDSFTDPFPPHLRLPVSARPILFLGPTCDGTFCPPSSIVQGGTSPDRALQTELPGVLGGNRAAFLFNDGTTLRYSAARIDAATGRLMVTPQDWFLPTVDVAWGSRDYPLNLALPGGLEDRVEIEVLASQGIRATFSAASYDDAGNVDGAGEKNVQTAGPGVVSISFSSLDPVGLPSDFSGDIDVLAVRFHVQDPLPGWEVPALGEVRIVSTTVAAEGATWGRVKSTYRR